jgi:hypothetical protein
LSSLRDALFLIDSKELAKSAKEAGNCTLTLLAESFLLVVIVLVVVGEAEY